MLVMSFDGGGEHTTGVAVGDLDQDGLLDIVFANDKGEANVLLLNRGGGVFEAAGGFPGGNDYTFAVALGDVDGDSDLDILFGNENTQNKLLLNQGDGSFVASTGFDGSLSTCYPDSGKNGRNYQCGSSKNWVCPSGTNACCSTYGWCGSGSAYCDSPQAEYSDKNNACGYTYAVAFGDVDNGAPFQLSNPGQAD